MKFARPPGGGSVQLYKAIKQMEWETGWKGYGITWHWSRSCRWNAELHPTSGKACSHSWNGVRRNFSESNPGTRRAVKGSSAGTSGI